jgi:hypothetical protein
MQAALRQRGEDGLRGVYVGLVPPEMAADIPEEADMSRAMPELPDLDRVVSL